MMNSVPAQWWLAAGRAGGGCCWPGQVLCVSVTYHARGRTQHMHNNGVAEVQRARQAAAAGSEPEGGGSMLRVACMPSDAKTW